MSKELGALSYLVETAIYGNKEDNRGKIFEAESILKQALTPPTEEEVCEALGEYLGEEVEHSNGMFIANDIIIAELFIRNDVHIMPFTEYTVRTYVALPPHLITLIGRFYEKESERE